MGARPYDPTLGRFLAIDPIDGGSLNNYDYAGQDPINGYDLNGLMPLYPEGDGPVTVQPAVPAPDPAPAPTSAPVPAPAPPASGAVAQQIANFSAPPVASMPPGTHAASSDLPPGVWGPGAPRRGPHGCDEGDRFVDEAGNEYECIDGRWVWIWASGETRSESGFEIAGLPWHILVGKHHRR